MPVPVPLLPPARENLDYDRRRHQQSTQGVSDKGCNTAAASRRNRRKWTRWGTHSLSIRPHPPNLVMASCLLNQPHRYSPMPCAMQEDTTLSQPTPPPPQRARTLLCLPLDVLIPIAANLNPHQAVSLASLSQRAHTVFAFTRTDVSFAARCLFSNAHLLEHITGIHRNTTHASTTTSKGSASTSTNSIMYPTILTHVTSTTSTKKSAAAAATTAATITFPSLPQPFSIALVIMHGVTLHTLNAIRPASVAWDMPGTLISWNASHGDLVVVRRIIARAIAVHGASRMPVRADDWFAIKWAAATASVQIFVSLMNGVDESHDKQQQHQRAARTIDAQGDTQPPLETMESVFTNATRAGSHPIMDAVSRNARLRSDSLRAALCVAATRSAADTVRALVALIERRRDMRRRRVLCALMGGPAIDAGATEGGDFVEGWDLGVVLVALCERGMADVLRIVVGWPGTRTPQLPQVLARCVRAAVAGDHTTTLRVLLDLHSRLRSQRQRTADGGIAEDVEVLPASLVRVAAARAHLETVRILTDVAGVVPDIGALMDASLVAAAACSLTSSPSSSSTQKTRDLVGHILERLILRGDADVAGENGLVRVLERYVSSLVPVLRHSRRQRHRQQQQQEHSDIENAVQGVLDAALGHCGADDPAFLRRRIREVLDTVTPTQLVVGLADAWRSVTMPHHSSAHFLDHDLDRGGGDSWADDHDGDDDEIDEEEDVVAAVAMGAISPASFADDGRAPFVRCSRGGY